MSTIFGLMAFASFVCLIISFVKPELFAQIWLKYNQEPSKGKTIGLFAVMFLATIVLSGATSGKKKGDAVKNETSTQAIENKSEADKPAEEKKAPEHKVGDVLKTKKFEIKITSVKARKSVGGQFFSEKAPDGASFICINFQYKNISPKPTSSAIKIKHLLDPNGTKYNEARGASTYYATENKFNTKVFSDINPGISIQDGKVFEVANELWKNKGWKAVVDTDDDDIEVMLN